MRARFRINGHPVAVDAEPRLHRADRLRAALSGDLCRCAGRVPIAEAALEARRAHRKAGKP